MDISSTTMRSTCPSSWRRPIDDLQGVRVDSQVSLVDVFPTVLALTGIEARSRVHGRSLLPLMFGAPDAGDIYAYSESMAPGAPIRLERAPLTAIAALQVHRGASS